jgi:glucokinase
MSLLVGDIGGTNTRLRLVSDDALHLPIHEHTYKGADLLRGFEWIVEDFLSNYERPTTACFAVAGPVVLNADGSATVTLTNLGWILNDHRLKIDLRIGYVLLINDFTAVCHGILQIRSLNVADQPIQTIQPGKSDSSAPIAVIGAGTGLGKGLVNNCQISPSEGGHASFAPNSDLEIELLKHLRLQLGHVSAERVVSGQGILAIYKFLRGRESFPKSSFSGQIVREIERLETWELESGEEPPDPPALIGKAANVTEGDPDPLSVEVMNLFIEAYGAEAGNLALNFLPYGGLYIAGGIVTKNIPLFTNERFLNAFTQKGRMSDLLTNIPVHIVTTEEIGLIGAIRASQ